VNALPQDIEASLLARLREDVECEQAVAQDDRVGCLTPLEYPNGDNVTIWVVPLGSSLLEVSDLGEATSESILSGHTPAAVTRIAAAVAQGHSVLYNQSRLTAVCKPDGVGECVWRVASAASQIAHAALSAQRRRAYPSAPMLESFSTEVGHTLARHDVQVVRNQTIEGSSGHMYKVPFFVPSSESILEPVKATGIQAPEVASTYATLGDLRNANGYQLYALLDDRTQTPEAEVGSLLTQVSTVVWWSRHEDWLANLA
jgi:hypothetical protein